MDLGTDLATEIAESHGHHEKPIRIPEGSSLVFRLGSEFFLKLTPPFFDGSIEAELLAVKVIGKQLPFPIPQITAEGNLGTWKYVITRAVLGKQAKDVFGQMNPENRMLFAADIGMAIRAIQNINTTGFETKFGPWEKYLSNRLANQKSIHLERGNTEDWAEKIQEFVQKYSNVLIELGPAKLVHADLNHEHLMLHQINDKWRLSGIIDFADAMNAPMEMDFVLPILCFYKGKLDFQKKMFESAEFTPNYDLKIHSNIMMALALQNRFIAFHDWFDREIGNGAQSVEEVAKSVFPPI